jgi:hypothetical protein
VRSEAAGYISQDTFIKGHTPEQMERILGCEARPSQSNLGQGADIYHFTRLVKPHAFALKSYTQLPGGVPWMDDLEWPRGLSAPQWQLTKPLPSRLVKWVARGVCYEGSLAVFVIRASSARSARSGGAVDA